MYHIVITISMLLLVSCGMQSNDEATQNDSPATLETKPSGVAKTLDVRTFAETLKKRGGQAILLDIRTDDEVKYGGIPGARHLDFYDDGFKMSAMKLGKDVPLFIYCASGKRSRQAMDMLSAEGFHEIYELEGGFSSWLDVGQPTAPIKH